MGFIRKFEIVRKNILELEEFPYSQEMHLSPFFFFVFVLNNLLYLHTSKLITKQKFEKGYISIQKAYKFTLNIYY